VHANPWYIAAYKMDADGTELLCYAAYKKFRCQSSQHAQFHMDAKTDTAYQRATD